MYCIKCGKANPNDAIFCGNCGTRLFVPKNARQSAPAQAPQAQPVQQSVPQTQPFEVSGRRPAAEDGTILMAGVQRTPQAQQSARSAETLQAQSPAYTQQPAQPVQPAYTQQPAQPVQQNAAAPAPQSAPAAADGDAPQTVGKIAGGFIRTVNVTEHPILRSELPAQIAKVKTVKRPWNFTQIHEYFTLRNASFENVRTVLDQTDFAGIKVKVEAFPDENSFAILGRNFGATLIFQGKENEFYRWRFAFAKWNDKAFTVMMNGAVTYVEQALLAIDPDTVYEEKFSKVRSKTSFF